MNLREIIQAWRDQGGIVAPEEALEVAEVIESILNAAELVVENWGNGWLQFAVQELAAAIADSESEEDEETEVIA